MTDTIEVTKDEESASQVPNAWRYTIKKIADLLPNVEDLKTADVGGFKGVSDDDASRINESIASYGCTLTSLHSDTWATSVVQWMGGYWDVIVDLNTLEEGPSDLAMLLRVRESDGGYVFEIVSVHVP
ncbi:MAG: hypothetical protein AAF662_06635 [Pseudomonadota bacterium]